MVMYTARKPRIAMRILWLMKSHGEWHTRWKIRCSCGALLAFGSSGVDWAGIVIEDIGGGAIAVSMRDEIERVEVKTKLGNALRNNTGRITALRHKRCTESHIRRQHSTAAAKLSKHLTQQKAA